MRLVIVTLLVGYCSFYAFAGGVIINSPAIKALKEHKNAIERSFPENKVWLKAQNRPVLGL